MATAAVVPYISPEEYVNMSFADGDCDYVDGAVLERNVGEGYHSKLQYLLIKLFALHEDEWNIRIFPEMRVRTSATRFRVPDICVVGPGRGLPKYFVEPPLLCIEIRSPEDTLRELTERCEEYVAMGVPEAWLFDPRARKAYVIDQNGRRLSVSGTLYIEGTAIACNLDEIFSKLDQE